MNLRVFVITSDAYLWAIKPFAYLFNIFWSSLQPVVVAGYTPPTFQMPPNFKFHSIAEKNYPPQQWSTALIKFLSGMPDQHFVLLLEDYWLTRTVDHRGIETLYEYMRDRPNILRMDLTNDRLHAYGDARHARDVESYGHYDLIYTNHETQYQMSLQAGIWSKHQMLKLLQPDRSPWETEIYTQTSGDMRVMGTRQWPCRYANAIWKGRLDTAEVEKVPQPHRDRIKGMIPKNFPRRDDE